MESHKIGAAEESGKIDEQRSTKHYTENYRSSNTYPIKKQGAPLVISHEWGKDGKCLQQVEHIRGHLRHNYS